MGIGNGVTAIDLAGTDSASIGRIVINGTATLDGDLEVAIVDGFVPAINDSFQPITFNALNGQFDNIDSTGVPAGMAIQATYNANDVTLTAVAALRGRSTLADDRSNKTGKVLHNSDDIASLLSAALGQWCSWEAASEACASLGSVEIIVANLDDEYLGFAAGNRIWVDDNGAGLGWFLDETPEDENEFGEDESHLGYDLLTVLSHEIGHLLGAVHTQSDNSPEEIMTESLESGVRHRVSSHDIDDIFAEDTDWSPHTYH